MNFNEILKELKAKYELAPKSLDVVEILVNKAFDVYNYYFIALKNDNGNVYLTDFANTLKKVQIDPSLLESIITKNNAKLTNETILMNYENEMSVKKFITLIDEIVKNHRNFK